MEDSKNDDNHITPLLPKNGLVYSEKGNLSYVLCKPKLIPIKSSILEKMIELENNNNDENNENDEF